MSPVDHLTVEDGVFHYGVPGEGEPRGNPGVEKNPMDSVLSLVSGLASDTEYRFVRKAIFVFFHVIAKRSNIFADQTSNKHLVN
jgi:hypothetical protein